MNDGVSSIGKVADGLRLSDIRYSWRSGRDVGRERQIR